MQVRSNVLNRNLFLSCFLQLVPKENEKNRAGLCSLMQYKVHGYFVQVCNSEPHQSVQHIHGY